MSASPTEVRAALRLAGPITGASLVSRYIRLVMDHPDLYGRVSPSKASRVVRAYLATTPDEQIETELHTGVCSREFIARLMTEIPAAARHRGRARTARHTAGAQ